MENYSKIRMATSLVCKRSVLGFIALGFATCISLEAQLPSSLNSNWTCSVNGQSVQVGSDGFFTIPNVSAPDQFGPGGPGTAPDFIADDFVRVICTAIFSGQTFYAFSDFFQIVQGETVNVGPMTFTDQPPLSPESLSISVVSPVNATLTMVGETAQLEVLAAVTGTTISESEGIINVSTGTVCADGDECLVNVTASTAWTTYRSSNPLVASVNENGVVEKIGDQPALVFITANNEGATAVTQITISPGDPLTDIEGIVQLADGTPAVGAQVSIVELNEQVATASDGSFQLLQRATSFGSTFTIGVVFRQPTGTPLIGSIIGIPPVPDGITDAGIITLVPFGLLDSDGDGFDDTIEIFFGKDPTNSQDFPDISQNSDTDTLSDVGEFVLGTSLTMEDSDLNGINDGDEDSDRDGLSDHQEFDLLRTNPFLIDSDGDGFTDIDENRQELGSDPNDPDSTPTRIVFSNTISYHNALRADPNNVGDPRNDNLVFSDPISYLNIHQGSQPRFPVSHTAKFQNLRVDDDPGRFPVSRIVKFDRVQPDPARFPVSPIIIFDQQEAP